jgi:hypothetical protein
VPDLHLKKLERLAEHLGVPFTDGEFEDEIFNARGQYVCTSPNEATLMNAVPKLVAEIRRLRKRLKGSKRTAR